MPALIGHADILRELRMLALSAEPPHALLFAGPERTGRRLLALEYAKMLNCASRDAALIATSAALPCSVCRSCRLIDDGAHPDVLTVAPGDSLCRPRASDSAHPKHPDSRDIRICQVRGLIDAVSRYPFEARYRLVLVDPAHRLAPEASNGLLKTLEEPPGHTAITLISSAPESILETILSRCRRIDVRPVPRAEIEAGLLARGFESSLAARAAEAARGRPGAALEYAADPDLINARGRLLERCARIAGERTRARFEYAGELAEKWRRDRNSATPELDAWEAFWERELRRSSLQLPPRLEVSRENVQALRAVEQCRADLLTNVVPRAAFELMLLSFPRRTLDETPEEEPAPYA
jgi:DNA polymerase-3 subunit delta'